LPEKNGFFIYLCEKYHNEKLPFFRDKKERILYNLQKESQQTLKEMERSIRRFIEAKEVEKITQKEPYRIKILGVGGERLME